METVYAKRRETDEFQQLTTRTDIVEREVEGEKMVTRHILEQTRRNGDDIATLTSKVDGLEVRLGRVEHKVDGLDRKFTDLTRSFPGIVGGAVREAIEPLTRER